MNYSTAKVLIRDLTPKERSLVKRLIKRREEQGKKKKEDQLQACSYKIVDFAEKSVKDHHET